jgi:hypothetical protein
MAAKPAPLQCGSLLSSKNFANAFRITLEHCGILRNAAIEAWQDSHRRFKWIEHLIATAPPHRPVNNFASLGDSICGQITGSGGKIAPPTLPERPFFSSP